jgi:hypothetical protein
MKYTKMNKDQLLAAETFSYSYANYDDHLGIGNERFDKLMPNDIKMLQTAEQEGWDIGRLADMLELEVENTEKLVKQYQRAKEIVFAPNAATSFQIGVKHSFENALEQGLSTTEDINELVEQICYRAADLAYLLDVEGKELSDYSEFLRGRNLISGNSTSPSGA